MHNASIFAIPCSVAIYASQLFYFVWNIIARCVLCFTFEMYIREDAVIIDAIFDNFYFGW